LGAEWQGGCHRASCGQPDGASRLHRRPAWSIIVVTVDVLVIYALAVHGRELRTA
jgi:hypothetical protein